METIDGSANEGEDYIAINETLTFEPFQKEKEVSDSLNVEKKMTEAMKILTKESEKT